MIQTTAEFNNHINQDSRTFRARFLKAGEVLDCEIKSITIYKGACGDEFSIGSIFMPYIDAEVLGCSQALENQELSLEIGLLLGYDDTGNERVEFIPIGVYTVTEPKTTTDLTSFTAVGRISTKFGRLYTSKLTYPATVQAVAAEISSQTGVPIIFKGLSAAGKITKKPTGLLHREMLGYLAGILGGFATEDNQGNVVISKFSTTGPVHVSGDRSIDPPEFKDYDYSLTGIKVIVKEDGEDEDGNTVKGESYSSGTIKLTVSNPYMTQALFNAMTSNIIGFTYRPGSVALALGDPRLEPWDCLAVTDTAGNTYTVPCFELTHTFDGGLTTEVGAAGTGDAEDEAEIKGPMSQQVDRMNVNIFTAIDMAAKRLKADDAELLYAKVGDLEATNARINNITAGTITTDYLEANYTKTTELVAKYATLGNLTAAEAKITKVSGELAEYKKVVSTDIEAVNAKFSSLSTEYAQIDLANIKDGCINTAMIGQGVVDTAQIKDGSITDAKIVALTANKITAGKLDAAEIEVINLNCANLTVGAINGQQIAPGAVDITKLSTELSGTITGTAEDVQNALADAGLAINKANDAATAAATAQSTANTAKTNASNAQAAADKAKADATTAKSAADKAQKDLTTAQANLTAVTNRVGATETEITAAQAAVTAAQTAANNAKKAADTAASAAATAQNTANTAKTNAATAQTAAENAQKAANAAAASASSAQTTADGKNTVFYQTSAPAATSRKVNDVWFDTDDGNKMYYWSGTAWTAKQFSTNAIAANAVTANLITAAAITAVKLATNAVTADKIYAGAVTVDKIAAGAVDTDKLKANAVTAAKIAVGTITAGCLAANSITAEKISANAVIATKIAANAITSDKIVADAITTAKIAAGAVTANEIATNAITAAKISAGAISADKIATGAITAAKITAGAVTADKISVASLQAISAKIGGFNIGSTYLANNTTALAGAANSVYLGTNGISCGTKFKVLADGSAEASNMKITGGQIEIKGNSGLSIDEGKSFGIVKIYNGCIMVQYDGRPDGGPLSNCMRMDDLGIQFYNGNKNPATLEYASVEAVNRIGNYLWSGSWSSGSITVSDTAGYVAFKIGFSDGGSAIAFRGPTYITGIGGFTNSAGNIATVSFNFTYSGNKWNYYNGVSRITHAASGSHTAISKVAITSIIGIVPA